MTFTGPHKKNHQVLFLLKIQLYLSGLGGEGAWSADSIH